MPVGINGHVMFGIGVGDLGWMVALTVVMASESAIPNERRSRRIRKAIGIALLLVVALWLAHPAWLAPATAS